MSNFPELGIPNYGQQHMADQLIWRQVRMVSSLFILWQGLFVFLHLYIFIQIPFSIDIASSHTKKMLRNLS